MGKSENERGKKYTKHEKNDSLKNCLFSPCNFYGQMFILCFLFYDRA